MKTRASFPGRGHTSDLIVVGAGISGSELALHAARAGRDVLLVTTSLDTVYNLLGDGAVLSPPPGTLMREVWTEFKSERAYLSTWTMHRQAKHALEHQPGIHLLQSSVSALRIADGSVEGVRTWEGVDRFAPRVVLAAGSFLHARLKVGELQEAAGRLSEMAYDDLYQDLSKHGFAFAPLCLEAPSQGGSLPYTVDCCVLTGEWQADTFRLPRLHGLYGVGVCVAGFLSHEDAARQGRQLAERLVAEA
ncbi:MAG TPA: FAD-dependent oxidoreductase [Trueperaceae bacterium]